MAEPLYRWADHASMPPRPSSYFVAYWSTMARPISVKAAERVLREQVRLGGLVIVPPPAPPADAPMQQLLEF